MGTAGGDGNLIENRSVQRGIGCASVIPAAWIGFAGLADGAGPQGWSGFAELIGWITICVAAGLSVAALLARCRQGRLQLYVSVAAATAAVAIFTYAPHWLGLYAPMAVKVVFTASLQFVGSLAAGGLILWLGRCVWSDQRRP